MPLPPPSKFAQRNIRKSALLTSPRGDNPDKSAKTVPTWSAVRTFGAFFATVPLLSITRTRRIVGGNIADDEDNSGGNRGDGKRGINKLILNQAVAAVMAAMVVNRMFSLFQTREK